MPELIKYITNYLHKIAALAVGLALVTLNIIRIFNVPITIDETGYNKVYSYTMLALDKEGYANNHIFHSLLRKFFVELFSDDLLFIRLDSLLAQIFYLLFSWLIFTLLFKNKWQHLFGFLILNIVSPFLFTFWGLSRGYALSVTFMTISIYYLLNYIYTKRLFYLSISFACAILAVYSNFSLINYFMALLGTVIIKNLLIRQNADEKNALLKELIISLSGVALLALLVTGPLIHVYKFGELSFLGSNGFIDDTIKSLVADGFYLRSPDADTLINIICYSVVGITCITGIFWIFLCIFKHRHKQIADTEVQSGIVLTMLLLLPAASLISQHLLFRINYVTDRAALFFIPLFFISFLYSLGYIFRSFTLLTNLLIATLLLVLSYNFTTKINLNSTLLWWFDADDLAVLKKVSADSKNKKKKIRIHVEWIFGPALYYDIHKYYPDKIELPIWDNNIPQGKDTSFDFYYIVSSTNTDTLLTRYHKDTTFLYGGSILYKKN